jgi:hypothetical protein
MGIHIDHLQYLNVSLSRNLSVAEPEAPFQNYTHGFDTSGIRRQLGVSQIHHSREDRGVLSLSEEQIWATVRERRDRFHPPNVTVPPDATAEVVNGLIYETYNSSIYPLWVASAATNMPMSLNFCLQCGRMHTLAATVNLLLSSLFDHVINDTGSPALALQACFTTIMRQAYYTWLPLFDAQGNSTSLSFVNRLAPVSHRGFWAVVGIIVVHVAICTFITIRFISKTKYSLLGNIWPAISQVVYSEDAQALLQDGTMKTDNEIKRTIRHRGGRRKRYRITMREEDEAVMMVPAENDK